MTKEEGIGFLNLKIGTILGIAILFDVLDLIGAIPIIGDGYDILVTVICCALFGPLGLIYIWEILSFGPLNIIDAFVPTMTLIFIMWVNMNKKAKELCNKDDTCKALMGN